MEHHDEINPITLYQAHELSQHKRIHFHIKIKQSSSHFSSFNPAFKPLVDRLETMLEREEYDQKVSQYYICGPPRFTYALISEFKKMETDPSRYTIV